MNLTEACVSAREGNFVTNEYFSPDQSMHYYKGDLYYEDGAVVTFGFLRSQEFAVKGEWRICIPKDKVDRDKLREMHESAKPLMLQSGSYMDCRKE